MNGNMKYRVSHYCGIKDLPTSAREVLIAAAQRDFFCSLDWFDLFEKNVVPAGATARYYVAEDTGGRALVVLPLMQESGSSRCLTGLANFYSLSFGPIFCPDASERRDILRSVIRHIFDEEKNWISIDLKPANSDDDVAALIAGSARDAGTSAEIYSFSENWSERIEGRDADTYIAARPGKVRSTLKRKKRKLEKEADFDIRIVQDEAGLEEAISDYLTVYDKSWKEDEDIPDFIPHLMRVCARLGKLRLAVLTIDGQPMASQFWFIHANRAVIYKLAYDPLAQPYSPGSVLTEALARQVIDADGVDVIDFGLGGDGFKKDWMNAMIPVDGVIIHNPRTLTGFVAKIKLLAKKFLNRRQNAPNRNKTD